MNSCEHDSPSASTLPTPNHLPPRFLEDYAELWRQEPRQACLAWFRESRYGLFLHYGLYSLLERHEWVQLRECIPVREYAKLISNFHADNFDADKIAKIACDAGMRYVNFTTRHHEGFSLFDTNQSDFQVLNSPCSRNLVLELGKACDRYKLGFFCYYSHGREWHHPHGPSNEEFPNGRARPNYVPPDPDLAYGKQHNLDLYIVFMSKQIDELLSLDIPIAGIWLDGIAVPKQNNPTRFRCQELYDQAHRSRPDVLVSYKQGVLGTEDFFAPEHNPISSDARPMEVCTTMAPGAWGYTAETRGTHLKEEHVWEKLIHARGCNLLLNTGILPDGALDSEDTEVLLRVGERLKQEGFPT